MSYFFFSIFLLSVLYSWKSIIYFPYKLGTLFILNFTFRNQRNINNHVPFSTFRQILHEFKFIPRREQCEKLEQGFHIRCAVWSRNVSHCSFFYSKNFKQFTKWSVLRIKWYFMRSYRFFGVVSHTHKTSLTEFHCAHSVVLKNQFPFTSARCFPAQFYFGFFPEAWE